MFIEHWMYNYVTLSTTQAYIKILVFFTKQKLGVIRK